MHDPIRDMLIRIKNAGNAGKGNTSMPFSMMKLAIAQVLMKEGYLSSVAKRGKFARSGSTVTGRGAKSKVLELGIAYEDKKPKVRGVAFISKPSRRVYFGVSDISSVRQGYGSLVLTTPKGIMTGRDARRERVGGEALFKIW